ncbi:MAG: PEP-CTERM sorting domain-containing protein [Akkermansiaceae bacterium]
MKNTQTLAVLAGLALTTASVNAALVSQFGILDLTANGGINPNTGVAWADGDGYRLAFHTDQRIAATSNDPATYDNFATAQAQQNTALAASVGWTALVWVNTDILQNQGVGPISDPKVRAGITDVTGGFGIGGAGVPVYAMDGTTSIGRNNSDIINTWDSPFANVDSGWGANTQGVDSAVRLAVGDGNSNTQAVHYSPFLDQFAAGDTGAQHGADVWTGGFLTGSVNPLGDAADDTTASRGSSNANNTGRVWNRFTSGTTATNSVYALSPVFTVTDVVPEPTTTALLGLGGLALIFRRRK